MTGLSGNEIYCLHLKNMKPGNLVIGNSVYSMGLLGSIGAGFNNMMGGEVTQITQIIHEGRLQSYQRMEKEAQSHGGLGVSGVTSELRHFHGNIEFLSVGSTVHAETGPARAMSNSPSPLRTMRESFSASWTPSIARLSLPSVMWLIL